MKTVGCLPAALLGLSFLATGANADPPAAPSPEDSAYAQDDLDGVPLVVREPAAKRLSPEEVEAVRKIQEKAARDKDWLVRGYEEQLKNQASTDATSDQNSNLYYVLSTDKDLAKLAGLPTLDLDNGNNSSATSYRTGATPTVQGSLALRTDPASGTAGLSSAHAAFKPLITPLSAADAAGLHNFYSPLSVSLSSPISDAPSSSTASGSAPAPAPAPAASSSQDSSDLDTPGLVAAEKDPLLDMSTPDVSLDLLPGETIDQAKSRQENADLVELPQPMDVTQLHEAQAAVLSAPGVAATLPTTPTALAAPPGLPAGPAKAAATDANAPPPISRAPQINPVRAPIADPYDILNR